VDARNKISSEFAKWIGEALPDEVEKLAGMDVSFEIHGRRDMENLQQDVANFATEYASYLLSKSAETLGYESAEAFQAYVEDQLAAAEQRKGLEMQILRLEGDTAAIRAIEIKAIHESNIGLQERIWALEDEAVVMREVESYAQRLKQSAASLASARRDLWGGSASPLGVQDQFRFQGSVLNAMMDDILSGGLQVSLDAMRELPRQITGYLDTASQIHTDPIAYAREVARSSLALSAAETAGRQRSESEELKDEIKALKEELAAMSLAVSKNTSDTAKYLERWEFGGMPAVRELS
jgi:hypothetical protein